MGILTMWGHWQRLKAATGAPVFIHPADGEKFNIEFDQSLDGMEIIRLGDQQLRTYHTPGHTPGQTCFDLGDNRIIVGDTIFVNGPGHTWSPEDFSTTIRVFNEVVLTWPDETQFFPGHGPSGTIGVERPAIEAFIEKGWPDDLHGDVTWK